MELIDFTGLTRRNKAYAGANGNKISVIYEGEQYFDFISSLQNEDCNAALKRIAPRVNLVKINALVDETPALTDLQRQFYKTMLAERKRKLLDLPLGKLENSK